MRFSYLFLIVVFLFSCKKEANESNVLVIGHAGMGLEFPGSIYHDNSEEAFQLALDINGCDGIEMDVRLSADGDLWAYHDDQLANETNNSGCIESLNFEALQDTKYKGVGSEKLKRVKDLNLPLGNKQLFLDLKHYNACEGSIQNIDDFISALKDLPELYQNTANVSVMTSNKNWVSKLDSAGYSVLFSSDLEAEIDAVFSTNPHIQGVAIRNTKVTKVQVEKYMNQSKKVYLFEVRSAKKLKEARTKSPTGVLSDDVQGAILEFK